MRFVVDEYFVYSGIKSLAGCEVITSANCSDCM